MGAKERRGGTEALTWADSIHLVRIFVRDARGASEDAHTEHNARAVPDASARDGLREVRFYPRAHASVPLVNLVLPLPCIPSIFELLVRERRKSEDGSAKAVIVVAWV